MKASSILSSAFLKAEELKGTGPQLLTIQSVEMVEFDGNKGKERKLQIETTTDRKLTLNKTSTEVLVSAFGDETDDWTGRNFVAYFDPDVRFGSKKTGGVRVKVPPTEA